MEKSAAGLHMSDSVANSPRHFVAKRPGAMRIEARKGRFHSIDNVVVAGDARILNRLQWHSVAPINSN